MKINEMNLKFKKKKSKSKKAKRGKNAEPNENEKRTLTIEDKVATFSSARRSDKTPSKSKSDQAARPFNVIKSTNPNLSDFKDTLARNTSYVRSTSSDVGSMSEFEKTDDIVGLDMENKLKEKEIENLILKRKVKRKKSKTRKKDSSKSGTGKTNTGKERRSPEKKQTSSKEMMSFLPCSSAILFAHSIPLADFDRADEMKKSYKSKGADAKDRPRGFD